MAANNMSNKQKEKKASFLKEYLECADLHKSVLNKIMN